MTYLFKLEVFLECRVVFDLFFGVESVAVGLQSVLIDVVRDALTTLTKSEPAAEVVLGYLLLFGYFTLIACMSYYRFVLEAGEAL